MKDEYRVMALSFSPKGQILAAGYEDGSVALWDTRTWRSVKPVRTGDIWVGALAWSPKGDLLAVGTGDGSLLLYGWPSLRLRQKALGNDWAVHGLCFDPPGRKLLTTGRDGEVREFSVDTMALLRRKPLRQPSTWGTSVVIWSPRGETWIGTASAGLQRWDTTTWQSLKAIAQGKGLVPCFNHLALSSDGRYLASTCDDGTLRIAPARTGQPATVVTVAATSLEGVAFGGHADVVAAAGLDGVLRLFAVPSGRPLLKAKIGGDGAAVACAPRSAVVAVGAGTGEVWVMRYGPQASVPGLRSIDHGRHQ